MLGGGHMNAEIGYAHDLLLDAYDDCGVFVFLLLIIILVKYCITMIKFFRNRKASLRSKILMLCVSGCTAGVFCLEPILYGELWLFAGFLMIAGLVEGYNDRSNSRIYIA